MLKKSILLFIISWCVCSVVEAQIVTGGNQADNVIDGIVAQVGEMPILLSDIETQKLQLQDQGAAKEPDCRILERVMYQKLLINQAKIDSIEVTDEQVNSEMERRLRVIEGQIGSREKLEEFYGMTYGEIKSKFRERIKNTILAKRQEESITSDVEVSPEEVKAFFNEIPEDSIPYINEKIAIQQIVIFPKITQASKDKAINQLKKWREEIVSGNSSFSVMATLHSEDRGSVNEGGKIKASRGMMVKPFEAAAFSLKPGEVSEVVKTEYGYHLIKLISRKGDQYTVRHILVSPKIGHEELASAATLMDECYQKLIQHKITWNQAVKEYSEDKETRQNFGNLSNPYTGNQYWDIANINEIDPQIFGVINGLDDGEISQPSLYTDNKSRKQGVRIVRIKDRTAPHKANLKDDYSFIKQAAESNKKQKIILHWVNQTIKKTYIRVNDKYNDCDFIYSWKN